jgi:hypothetical protein
MEKEIKETVKNLCEWIDDRLKNGCSSEELQLLPELVKSTAILNEQLASF